MWTSLVVAVLCSTAGSPASPDASPKAVTFAQALRAGDAGPKALALEEAGRVRREGDAKISGMPGPLQVGVYPGLRVSPSSETGPQIQIQVTQPISLSKLGRTRRRAASAERDLLSASADAAQLERQLDVAQAWIDAWSLQQQLDLLHDEAETIEASRDATRKLVDAGERRRDELATADAWNTELKLQAIELEGQLHHAGLRLAELVGEEGDEPLLAAGQPPVVQLSSEDLARLAEGAEDVPAVTVQRLAAAAARAQEAELAANAGWVLNVGGMVQVDQPGPAVGVFGQVGVQFPTWGRNARGRSAARADAVRLDGEAEELRRATKRHIRDTLHELEHTQEQRRALDEELIPALDDVAALEARSFASGESTTRRVVQARRATLQARRRMAALEGQYTWARLRVWLMHRAREDATSAEAK